MEKICKHCKKKFNVSNLPKGWIANHSRWCSLNPKRIQYENQLEKTRSFIDDNIVKTRNESIKKAWKSGAYDKVDFRSGSIGKKHTLETKTVLREKALNSPHRRLKKNVINYKGILLDSSWELELAKRLDFLKIKWIRPAPMIWKDENGISRHYFPDFYLPEHNLYLDPKNPQAFRVQEKKIKILKQSFQNLLFLTTLEQIKNFTVR